ncbi:MAG: caspase family protein [Cytophagales bacterium]|nr:caspase family protein [Cytophagales bacterium]MDW8383868.1 DUF6175 family protein [Flammeovirgaceae bacterium]
MNVSKILIAFLGMQAPLWAQKLIVIPKIQDGQNLCIALENNPHVVDANKQIAKVLSATGYQVVDFMQTLKRAKPNGVCDKPLPEIQKSIAELAQADVYFLSDIAAVSSPTGMFVTLTMSAYQLGNEEMLFELYEKTNKFVTDDVGALAKRAINQMLPKLKENISSITLVQSNQFQPLRTSLREIKLESDVDINIPKTNKTNPYGVAVVIGNRDYIAKDIPSVDFAIHDARAIKEYLIKMLGFKEENIIYIENATQANFNAIFGTENNHKAKLFNYMKPNRQSDIFIYYSGHGAPDPESKEGYFVPVDCDPSLVKFNGYSLSTLYTNLSKLDYRTCTVVIDACFSGSSEKGMLIKNISPVFISTRDKILTDEFAMIFTSASSEQVSSWYPEKKHSLFTYFFLKGLKGAANKNLDSKITLQEMREYLIENVSYMARRLNNREQIPQIIGDDNRTIVE